MHLFECLNLATLSIYIPKNDQFESEEWKEGSPFPAVRVYC